MQGKTFGAHVYGFEPDVVALQGDSQDQVRMKLRELLATHSVLVFHDISSKMTPEMHVKFTQLLGRVNVEMSKPPKYLEKGIYNSPDAIKRVKEQGGKDTQASGTAVSRMLKAAAEGRVPEAVTRIVKEPSDLVAFGEGWHSDLTFWEAPPGAAALVSRELPATGGNTHFLDMVAAMRYLPVELREKASQLQAKHTDGAGRWAVHPVVRRDGGEESLFVNKAFTREILGEQDNALLEELLEFIDRMPTKHTDTFLNIAWEKDQMVVWDNRYVAHRANADYTTRREMHRVITQADPPY